MAMRRYYFDLRDENGLFVDDAGMECRDMRAVQAEAAYSLADMARDAIRAPTHAPGQAMSIEVRDGDGPVMQVRFTFEIKERPGVERRARDGVEKRPQLKMLDGKGDRTKPAEGELTAIKNARKKKKAAKKAKGVRRGK